MKNKISRTLFTFTFLITVAINCNSQNWSWARLGVSTGTAYGMGVCTDSTGNVFATGGFSGSSITFGSFTLTNGVYGKVYLLKYDALGNVIWANTNGLGSGMGYSVSSDKNGNVYLTGTYGSASISFGTYTLNQSGTGNVFVVKYDNNGNVLWAKGSQAQSSITYKSTTDKNGNTFVAGNYNGSSCVFDTYTISSTGSQNVFLTKYDTNGNVAWAKTSNGSTYDNGYSVGVDSSGNSYFAGYFSSPTITFGSFTLTNSGGSGNAFLVKYDSNGNEIWALSSIGAAGGSWGQAFSLSTDVNGNSYLSGSFNGPLTFGTYTLTLAGNDNPVLIKFDTNGNVIWGRTGNGTANGYAVSADGNSVYLSGSFLGTLTFNTNTLTAPPGATYPMFIVRYDVNGNLIYATSLTSGGDNHQNNSAVDSRCNAYFTSDFRGNPTTLTIGANSFTQTGTSNPFISKLSANCLSTNFPELTNNNSNQIIIFPNPGNGALKFEVHDEIKDGQIILVNTAGQKVFEQKITPGLNSINASQLSKGLYNYIFLSDKQRVSNGKVVIE